MNGLARSDPCQHCYSAIKEYGIKTICFSDGDGNMEKHRLSDYLPTHVTTGHKYMKKVSYQIW